MDAFSLLIQIKRTPKNAGRGLCRHLFCRSIFDENDKDMYRPIYITFDIIALHALVTGFTEDWEWPSQMS